MASEEGRYELYEDANGALFRLDMVTGTTWVLEQNDNVTSGYRWVKVADEK